MAITKKVTAIFYVERDNMGITEFYTQEQANKLLEKNNKPHIKAKSQINKKTELTEFYCTKHNYTWKQTFSNVLTKQYICNYYKEHPYCSQKEMMTIFHISRNTLWKYLKKGYKYGLCPKYVISSEKYVLCEESEIIFSSYSECGKFYNIDSSSIRKCCNGLLEYFRGLHFIHLADYKGNINDLKPNYDIKANDGRKTRNVIHYNRNNNCIGIFKNAKTFCKETKYCEKTVYKVLHNDNILPDGTFLYYIDSDPTQPDKSKIIA